MANFSDSVFKPYALVNGEWVTIEKFRDLIAFFCRYSYDCPGSFNEQDNTISLFGRWCISGYYEQLYESFMPQVNRIFDKYNIEKCKVLFGDMDICCDFAEFGVMEFEREGVEIKIFESISPSYWLEEDIEDDELRDDLRYECFDEHCVRFFEYHKPRKKRGKRNEKSI